MGVGRLAQIAASLIEAGRAPQEPAGVIEAGTMPAQRTVHGTLATIAERVASERVGSPSITVVGPVAELAEQLAWVAQGPLAGLTVAVTRARAQASGLALALEDLGARIVQAPVIGIEPIPGPSLNPAPYDLVCLTSPNGVSGLFERLDDGTHPAGDARALAGTRVAAIGPGTAAALAEHGVTADIIPKHFVAESLVQALAGVPVERALVAGAKEARDVLPDALRARGAQVDVLDLYETLAEPLSPGALAAAQTADYITFTSSSTVRFFLDAAGGNAGLSEETRIVSIGPITSEELRKHGLQPHIEAAPHSVEGIIQALLADAASTAR